jgi:hypothetical protein
MSSFLNRKVTETRGTRVGTSTTWSALYGQIEEGSTGTTVLFRDTDTFTGGATFDTSVLNELRRRRDSEIHGHIAVFSFPKEIYDDRYKLYWFCLNLGSYLTGNTTDSGNAMHLACNSLASASYKLSENSTEESRQNFINTVTWTSKFFSYMMDSTSKSWWQSTKDAYNLLIKQSSSENLLRPISAMVILGSMGIEINRWALLEKIFISVSRTYHDCNKDLVRADSLGRIFVYTVLLDLLCGVPLETVVATSKSDFVKSFTSMKTDDKNLRVMMVLVGKILNNTPEDSISEISKSIMTLMDPRKLKTLSKAEIQNGLSNGVVVNGKMLKTIDLSRESYFTTCPNTKMNGLDGDSINVSFSNGHWYTVAFTPPSEMTSVSLDITGEFSDGSGGKPGVRIFSGPAVEWRKRGHQGLTSNGGRGDGFGAPTPLSGTCNVHLPSFKGGMKHLARVTINKVGSSYDVSAKFDGWSRFHKIHHTAGNKILIAAKAFAINVQTVNLEFGSGEEKLSGGASIGGTTLFSMTSGSSLEDQLKGLSVSNS